MRCLARLASLQPPRSYTARRAVGPKCYACCAFSSDASSKGVGLTHVDADTGQPKWLMLATSSHQEGSAAESVVVFPAEVARIFRDYADTDITFASSSKGPVVSTAIIAGVMGAKKTSELIPFCHPLAIEKCSFNTSFVEGKDDQGSKLVLTCTVRTFGKTGVEMEALTGASVAALCVYDMTKALSKDIVIASTRLLHKSK